MIKRTDLAETRKLPMLPLHMGVSLNGGTPKSSILVSDFQLPLAIGVPPFMETPYGCINPELGVGLLAKHEGTAPSESTCSAPM
jgi:hypothetical protein